MLIEILGFAFFIPAILAGQLEAGQYCRSTRMEKWLRPRWQTRLTALA